MPLTRCGREEEGIYNSELERSVNIRRSFQKEEGYHVEPPPYELIKREGMERGLEIGAERGKIEKAREADEVEDDNELLRCLKRHLGLRA